MRHPEGAPLFHDSFQFRVGLKRYMLRRSRPLETGSEVRRIDKGLAITVGVLAVILLVVLVLPFVAGKFSGEGGEKVRGGLILLTCSHSF